MELNKLQAEVVNSDKNKIVCLAGAGSGKTHTVLERINKLIQEGEFPETILGLTFTNVAARNLTDRFKRSHPKITTTPKFCTFHAFCYSLIVTDSDIRKKVGYNKIPHICVDAVLKRIIGEAEVATGIKKDFNPTDLRDKREQEILDKYIRKMLIERNMITFDIMCNDVCNLFANDEEVVAEYITKYKYIFVDEFQDTDKLQWKFVQAFKNSDICVVADILQCIYRFRGTDDSIVKELCKDNGWEVYKLKSNYRSDKSIVKYANNFSEYADKIYRIEMNCESDKVGLVDDAQYTNISDMNNKILEYLDIEKSTAILARTNKEIYYIQQLLKENNVPFRNTHTTPNMIGIELCKSLSDIEYASDWLSSFISKDLYNNYLRDSISIEPEGRIKLLQEYRPESKSLATMLHHYYYLSNVGDNIEKIIKYLVYEVKTSSRILKDVDNIDQIIEVLSVNSDDNNSIYVGTIHSVKGLEFDNVIVTGVNSRSFKLDNEDNNNLFYVAVTRAKHHLVVLRKGG